jgi:hypothetical protein
MIKNKMLLVLIGLVSLLNIIYADVVLAPTPFEYIIPVAAIIIVGAVIAGIVAIVIYLIRKMKKKPVTQVKK